MKLVNPKKIYLKRITICSLIIFLAFISIFPNPANASNSSYSLIEYQCVSLATIDGSWTTSDEWIDGPRIAISDNASFTYNFDMTSYAMEWLIEFFSDNTTDSGDYWQICLDADNSGGAAPQIGDFKIEIQGHTTLRLYEGNGTNWTEVSPDQGELTWVNSIGTSPWNSQPHWILELSDSSKRAGTIQTLVPPNGMRVATYDASSSELTAWAPNSNADVPDQWGLISTYSASPFPTPTITPTQTPIPTATANPTPTATPRPTVTPTPTQAPTPTPIVSKNITYSIGQPEVGLASSNPLPPKTFTLSNYTTHSDTGKLVEINVYLTYALEGTHLRAIIFANEPESGFPFGTSPIAESEEILINQTVNGDWFSFPINFTAEPNTTYWIGYYSDAQTQYGYDQDSSSITVTSQQDTDDSHSTNLSWSYEDQRILSLYAIYTPDESIPSKQDIVPQTSSSSFEAIQDGIFVLLIIFGETIIFAKGKNLRRIVK